MRICKVVTSQQRDDRGATKVRGGQDNKRAADQVDLVVEGEFPGKLFLSSYFCFYLMAVWMTQR